MWAFIAVVATPAVVAAPDGDPEFHLGPRTLGSIYAYMAIWTLASRTVAPRSLGES